MTNKLTIGQIKRLPNPASGYVEHSANSIPGLRIRCISSGVKSWVFRYKCSGKNNVITIGRINALSIIEAETAARAYRAQIALGQDPAQTLRDNKQQRIETRSREDELNPTFTAFADEYLERYAKKRKRSWQTDADFLKRHILPVLGGLRIQSITRRDIARTLNKMRDAGITTTSNRVRSVLHKMFNWAIQQGWLEHNPVANTERLKEHARDRVLSDAEMATLWASTADDTLGYALRFILLSGQRPGEVAALRWEDIHDDVWWLEQTKNGKPHKVPVSLGMWKVLDDVKALQGAKCSGNGYVFPGRSGKQLAATSLAHAMARITFDCATDKKPKPHDLRRTAATTVSRLGHPRVVITKLLNHSESGNVDAIYDRWSYLPETLKALDDLWGEVQRVVGLNVVEFPKLKAVTA